jgi:NADP-dependent 3-hydroxy acid dehydrogenase YdfG
MASLEEQVVLVTGCSTGIGHALAPALKAAGHRPFATARRPEMLADLAKDGIETLALDVTEPESILQAVAAVSARAGRIDVLINNAGVNAFGPVIELSVERVRRLFDTNVLGLLAVTQAVFPHFAEQRSGRIVNVGSLAGLVPTPFAGPYCATKSAVHMLSEVLRMEVKPFGVDVVVVQPGGVRSNIAANGSAGLDQFRGPPSRYAFAYDGIVKRANFSQDNPMPAEDFARELVRLAFEIPAPRVVRLGTGANQVPQLAELSPDQRDAMLSANFGLAEVASK